MKKGKKVSVPVLRRLPLYHYFISDLRKKGEEVVSASTIAKYFNIDSIKVRKDLTLTGSVGKPKIGFKISEVIKKIEDYLGWSQKDNVILVGCGDLGSALLGHELFLSYGLNITTVFDSDPKKIGKKIHGRLVLPVEDLLEVCKSLNVKIAIITVPADQAQQVADVLINGGIKGIWNFAPTALKVPESIVVQSHSMATPLAILVKKVYGIAEEEKKEEK